MMTSTVSETPYPLYKNQMTLYLSYDANKKVLASDTIRDFALHIPNNMNIPSNTQVVIQVIRVSTGSFQPSDTAGIVNTWQLRSPDLPNLQSLDSYSGTNATILASVPRLGAAADYYIYVPYDKVFQSFKSISPFGKNIRFQLTDYKGNLLDNGVGELPDTLDIIMNVFW